MRSDDGWREMTYRVYRLDPETGEEQTLRQGLVRLHESWHAEPAPSPSMMCHCPRHPGGVALDVRGLGC